MPSERHMKAGSPCPPPPEPGKLRLYSMRFCPYAQRTRLFLAAKGIKYETINIHLKDKPDWFVEKNPIAKVPVLEKDGEIIYESLVCDEFLDGIYPDKRITASDPLERARQSMVLALWDAKVVGFYYQLILAKEESKRPAIAQELMSGLQYIEKALTGPFFCGDKVGALDYHLWPWFERLHLLKSYGVDVTAEKFPKLTAWMARVVEVPAVKELLISPEDHQKYFESWMAGNPDYDMGLKE